MHTLRRPPPPPPKAEFVKRVRAAKIHLLLIGHMRKQMPTMFGHAKVQKKMMDEMADQFFAVQREYHLPVGDFPDVTKYVDTCIYPPAPTHPPAPGHRHPSSPQALLINTRPPFSTPTLQHLNHALLLPAAPACPSGSVTS